jgi:hypothetical protein
MFDYLDRKNCILVTHYSVTARVAVTAAATAAAAAAALLSAVVEVIWGISVAQLQ